MAAVLVMSVADDIPKLQL